MICSIVFTPLTLQTVSHKPGPHTRILCTVKSATQQLGTRLAPQRLAADEPAPSRTNGLHACVPPCTALRNFRTRSERPHSLRRRTVSYSEVRRKFDRSTDRASRETKMSERYNCYYYYYYCYYYYYKNTCALRYGRICSVLSGCEAHILKEF
jgi:hypothetical protein